MESIYVLGTFALGWALAQTGKLVIALIQKKGKMSASEILAYMFKSGGMPSGHTASFLGASMMVGFIHGFDSAIFALAIAMTIIIVYDATNVRYAVGQQGKLLNEIAKKDGIPSTKPIKLVEGHTIPEVIVGGILGILIAFVMKMVCGL